VLSEGYMWRHHPQADRVVELIAEGVVGAPRLIRGSFSFPLDRPDDVRWDPELDGGALLDVGCYCVSAARLLAGEPERVRGEAVHGPRGVDRRFVGTLRFAGDVLATFDCGFDLPHRGELEVVGAEGALRLPDPWHAGDPKIEVRPAAGSGEDISFPPTGSYRRQFEDVSAAVREGRPPRLGRDDALGQARALAALAHSAADGRTVDLPETDKETP
jgi:xylose dehydrogenase (NAD/NADP)